MRRSPFLIVGCLFLVSLAAWVGAGNSDGVAVVVKLVDEATEPIGGVVRVFRGGSDEPVPLPGLLDRLQGVTSEKPMRCWHVVGAAGAATRLAKGDYRVEAFSGLETARTTQTVVIGPGAKHDVIVKLPRLFPTESDGWTAGNTHLHLMKLTRQQADDYLRQIPAADGLKVLFLSYLERTEADKTYITNQYPIGDLDLFPDVPVVFANGEEHRHNFKAYGEGYGHVMLLGIQRLVKPVSIGAGIMLAGPDDPALRPGIDDARNQGGTIIWCHNTNGVEDVPTALAGKLDAINVFDGSRTGTYEDNYYRYLNIGIRLPISTGTDWFLYDFSRVYAKVAGRLTAQSWLEAVKAGRCFATNGPYLSLRVDGRGMGDAVDLDKPRALAIEAAASGRGDFQRLQLVHNGRVIYTERSTPVAGGFKATIARSIPIDQPGWFAVRIESDEANELGPKLYAHSSPVYVTLGGRSVFDVASAQALLEQLEQALSIVRTQADFSSPPAGQKVTAIYESAIKDLLGRINERK